MIIVKLILIKLLQALTCRPIRAEVAARISQSETEPGETAADTGDAE